jgi:glyoxylase-like metal-dependent hydrolase (beta-lactamase superfamily II)
MAMAAEPRRADLPLPGGREGATVRLHPLLSARSKIPRPFFHREPGRLAGLKALGFRIPDEEWIDIPTPAYLVEHPTAGPILIDTGLHPAIAVEGAASLGRIAKRLTRDLRMDPEQALHPQLRERGIEPSEVRTVVMTHLHYDHASGVSEFPDATFVVSAQEWEAASSGGPLDGYIKRQYDHAFDWRTVDFERGEIESHAPFGRAADLFGDGSVRLVFTPGHTLGHCSVLLRLRGRNALLIVDAAYDNRTLEESSLPYKTADDHTFKRSLREVQLYIENNPHDLVIPGHDMAAWRLLDSVYE